MNTADPQKLFDKALQLQSAGKLQKAHKSMKQVSRMTPNAGVVWLHMGVLEGQMNDLKRAQSSLEKAVKLLPDLADAHFNLAEVFRALSKTDQAIVSYNKTLTLDRHHRDAMYGLGLCLSSKGDYAAAVEHLQSALKLMPSDPDCHLALAMAVLNNGEITRAKHLYLVASQQFPDNPDAATGYLQVLRMHGRTTQIIRQINHIEQHHDIFKLTAELLLRGPEGVERAVSLGKAMEASGRLEDATKIGEILQKNLLSTDAGTHLLGNVAVQQGDFDTAENLLKKAIRLNKYAAGAYQQLSVIGRLDLEARQHLEHMMNDEEFDVVNRSQAGLALYRLLRAQKDYKNAFKALSFTKQLTARNHPYEPDKTEQNYMRLKETFTHSSLTNAETKGCDGDGAIFVVGMPRSGTTLTEQILAAHSKVHAGGERDDMITILETLNFDVTRIKELPANWPSDIGKKLHSEMFKDAGACEYATDKLPGNVDYAGLIAMLLPKAKFIYCHRTPQDCALSNFEQSFSTILKFSFDLKALAHKYAMTEDIVRYWRDTCKLKVFDLDYDAMVQDAEPHIRKLLEFVGLEFEEACLYPNEVKRDIRTASVFQVRQPISAKSVGRWKVFEDEMEPFTTELARLRKELGL